MAPLAAFAEATELLLVVGARGEEGGTTAVVLGVGRTVTTGVVGGATSSGTGVRG